MKATLFSISCVCSAVRGLSRMLNNVLSRVGQLTSRTLSKLLATIPRDSQRDHPRSGGSSRPVPHFSVWLLFSSLSLSKVFPSCVFCSPLILSLRHGLLLFSPLKKQLGGGDGTESTTYYHYQPRYIAGA